MEVIAGIDRIEPGPLGGNRIFRKLCRRILFRPGLPTQLQHGTSLQVSTFVRESHRKQNMCLPAVLRSAAIGAGAQNAAFAEKADSRGGVGRKLPLRKGMAGFMLAHEQFTGAQLVELGARAEKAGFDLLATSDHFQPWQANQGHAGEAWVTLGALTKQTSASVS
jgi:hypothetical protein